MLSDFSGPTNYKQDMSEWGTGITRAWVGLRSRERRQMGWVAQCPDDLVGADHPVRLVVAAVVEKLDVSRFHEPIKAREGQAGRDATGTRLPVSLWLYACIRGIGSARSPVARAGLQPDAFRRRAADLDSHGA
jgi:hypothetical protein